MSKLYSNTLSSSLASEQVQRTERVANEIPNNTTHTQHRRHNSLSGRTCLKSLTKSVPTTDINQKLDHGNTQYDSITLPDRITSLSCNSRNSHDNGCDKDEVDGDDTRRRRMNATKDAFLESTITPTIINTSSMFSDNEPDHLQHRFSQISQSTVFNARHIHDNFVDNSLSDMGCNSEMSSAFSSACPSTISSPLSTPTRLPPHFQQQHKTCPKSIVAPVKNSCSTASLTHNSHHQQHNNSHHSHLPEHNDHDHHQPHCHDQHKTSLSLFGTTTTTTTAVTAAAIATTVKSGNKNLKKFDPRFGPSPYRQLLPIALCILSFATVFSILIVYMDTTEIRHQQFRLNMSRDYELYGVAQDDPQLIAFLREIHMRKYPNHVFKSSSAAVDDGLSGGGGGAGGSGTAGGNSLISNTLATHLNFSAYPNELTPKMAYYVANVLQGKVNGAVIQSLTGSLGHLMTAPWLSETLNWAGIIVEPEPKRYFTLRKQNALRPRLQVVHACVSPNPYPKEVTIHNEESEVRINSLLDEETSWFNSRVKCFPLYTIMLASNRVEYDLLSLGVHGHELEILQTLPFDKIKIEIISIHLMENQEDISDYVEMITKFLQGKSYKIQKKFGRNYFYQRLTTSTNTMPTQTRKKDILLLKTP